MNRLDDLHLFLRTADLGSISKAARSLDLSVAVASQRLKRLERELGVRLLHRTTRRLRLTPEGAALIEEGRLPIESLEALTGSLRRAGSEVVGTLRMSIPASFARQYISPLLPAFLRRHAALRLHVDVADQTRELAADGYDLAIRIGHLPDSTLIARRLAPNRRVLCASPRYLRRRGTPLQPQDLAGHDCLLLAGRRTLHDIWRLRAPEGTEFDVRVRGRLETNVGDVIREAALAGEGIAMHSLWHISEDLRAGRLRQVLPGYEPPESGIYAVMPQRRYILPRVRAFVEFLLHRFGDVPPWERAAAAPGSRLQR